MNTNLATQIHEASIEILDNPGVKIEHDGILRLLKKAGAVIRKNSSVVRLPEELVKECIEQAPSEVTFADRRSGDQKATSKGKSLIWSVPGMNILRHGKHRRFLKSDMADIARLIDQLPEVNGVFGMSMEDVHPRVRDIVGLRVMAENTTKHIRVLSFTPEGADAICEMRSVLGDFPWFSMGFTAHGPLRWTNLALEIFARTAKRNIPVTINGEPMAGVSGPVTLAGSAAVGNAEILAGLVVNQILEPGRPCIYNFGLAHIFDMRTAIAVTGAPENHLFADISAKMGRFYNLPSCSWVSTESMCPDSQAALEKGMGFLSHLQSGVNVIWGVGQLESELTISPAQALIDNEIIGYARRLLRGVEVTNETLSVDLIREVGISGEYLSSEHTLVSFSTEFFDPSILFRNRRSDWEANGSKTLYEIAEVRADELINQSHEKVLTDEQVNDLKKIEQSFVDRILS
ncbi:trimethylamine methyltransferase family protein [Bacteroidota bacterium]